MNRSREVLTGSLCITLLAAVFCVWSAFGNDVNFCVTAGCSLYQDFTLGGISLWWAGGGTFAVLALLALVGASALGRLLSGLALLGDTALLLLMSLTAPCVNCLAAAVFFAISYMSFRHAEAEANSGGGRGHSAPRRSYLVWAWVLLFIINVGAVARSQAGIWAITDNASEATVRMFFSPSCPSCREGIELLSGNVDVAFYPLAENDQDIHKVARMHELVESGMNMADAMNQAKDAPLLQGFAAWRPEMLWLRFHMLRNKAHVFSSGAQTVPFFEYHGLPSMLARQKKKAERLASTLTSPATPDAPITLNPEAMQPPAQSGGQPDGQPGQDATLPLEPLVSGQCGGVTPCP